MAGSADDGAAADADANASQAHVELPTHSSASGEQQHESDEGHAAEQHHGDAEAPAIDDACDEQQGAEDHWQQEDAVVDEEPAVDVEMMKTPAASVGAAPAAEVLEEPGAAEESPEEPPPEEERLTAAAEPPPEEEPLATSASLHAGSDDPHKLSNNEQHEEAQPVLAEEEGILPPEPGQGELATSAPATTAQQEDALGEAQPVHVEEVAATAHPDSEDSGQQAEHAAKEAQPVVAEEALAAQAQEPDGSWAALGAGPGEQSAVQEEDAGVSGDATAQPGGGRDSASGAYAQSSSGGGAPAGVTRVFSLRNKISAHPHPPAMRTRLRSGSAAGSPPVQSPRRDPAPAPPPAETAQAPPAPTPPAQPPAPPPIPMPAPPVPEPPRATTMPAQQPQQQRRQQPTAMAAAPRAPVKASGVGDDFGKATPGGQPTLWYQQFLRSLVAKGASEADLAALLAAQQRPWQQHDPPGAHPVAGFHGPFSTPSSASSLQFRTKRGPPKGHIARGKPSQHAQHAVAPAAAAASPPWEAQAAKPQALSPQRRSAHAAQQHPQHLHTAGVVVPPGRSPSLRTRPLRAGADLVAPLSATHPPQPLSLETPSLAADDSGVLEPSPTSLPAPLSEAAESSFSALQKARRGGGGDPKEGAAAALLAPPPRLAGLPARRLGGGPPPPAARHDFSMYHGMRSASPQVLARGGGAAAAAEAARARQGHGVLSGLLLAGRGVAGGSGGLAPHLVSAFLPTVPTLNPAQHRPAQGHGGSAPLPALPQPSAPVSSRAAAAAGEARGPLVMPFSLSQSFPPAAEAKRYKGRQPATVLSPAPSAAWSIASSPRHVAMASMQGAAAQQLLAASKAAPAAVGGAPGAATGKLNLAAVAAPQQLSVRIGGQAGGGGGGFWQRR